MKHVGLCNAQKIIVVLHKLEGEEHMCLCLYNEKIPPAYKPFVLECLNSEEGQEAKELASVLETKTLPDGRNLGQALYSEGNFKKIPTNQVFVTPDSINKIRLNELNEYLHKISEGGEALKKMELLDQKKGMKRLKTKPTVLDGLSFDPNNSLVPLNSVTAPAELMSFSEKLQKTADALLVEAKRLSDQAATLQATQTQEALPVKAKSKKKASA